MTRPLHPQRRRKALQPWSGAFKVEAFPLAAGIGVALTMLSFDVYYLTAIGVGLFAFCLVWYIEALGHEIVIIPTTALIASAQWLVGPYIAYYHVGGDIAKYRMYVDEEVYMQFVVPSMFAFIIAMRAIAPRIDFAALRQHLQSVRPLPATTVYLLIAVGIATRLLSGFAPGPLKFLFFLLSQAQYVGVIYLLIYGYQNKWFATVVVFALALWTSSSQGFFHELILWSAMVLSFICLELKLSRAMKFALVIAGAFFLVQLQAIKSEYRARIQQNTDETPIVVLVTMLGDAITGKGISREQRDFDLMVARLNQGWIISAVMFHVPDFVPHANGQTVTDAIRDSLVPRFLVQKRTVAVSDAFEKYTGLSVGHNTSFGISVVGEAWVNFGWYGVVFMGVWGAFFGVLMRVVVALSATRPTFILWSPLLFLQAVKAETELVVALNHQVKALIFILLVYWAAQKIFRVRI